MLCESCGHDVHCSGCDICPRCLSSLFSTSTKRSVADRQGESASAECEEMFDGEVVISRRSIVQHATSDHEVPKRRLL